MTCAFTAEEYIGALRDGRLIGPEQAPLETRYIAVGGRKIRLNFYTRRGASFVMPAFRHLEREVIGEPSLTVTICDAHSATDAFRRSPWREEIEASRDKILMLNADAFHMQYNPDTTIYSLIDVEAKQAFYYANDFDTVPYYEQSAPLKFILHWWSEAQGFCLVHAAAVGVGDTGVLIVGRGGSGKSTTAVSAALHGLRYAGDDYVVLSHQSEPSALSIYCSGKVNGDVLAGLPVLQPHIVNPDRQATDKALVFLGEPFRSVWTESVQLKAIIATKITGGKVSLRQSPATLIFAEIASSTIFQMPGSGSRTLAALKKLFQELPVYTLELDVDLAVNAGMIHDFCLHARGEK
jgi:hypothetical protein